MKKETRNSKLLKSFTKYCKAHPTMRFWQALLGWSKLPYIIAADSPPEKGNLKGRGSDTFYWENKTE